MPGMQGMPGMGAGMPGMPGMQGMPGMPPGYGAPSANNNPFGGPGAAGFGGAAAGAGSSTYDVSPSAPGTEKRGEKFSARAGSATTNEAYSTSAKTNMDVVVSACAILFMRLLIFAARCNFSAVTYVIICGACTAVTSGEAT